MSFFNPGIVVFSAGGVIVGTSSKGARLQHWADMMKHPGQTINQTHFLSASFID